uniref:Uncharacterized protein n=1 Tax=Vitrella brassicaformis TaxID=1169539 RepID=A0A7S1KBX9_9ALVE
MAFIGGVASGFFGKATKAQTCRVKETQAVSKGRWLMKKDDKDEDQPDDPRRGFNLFKEDMQKTFFEDAPSRVVGSSQNYSMDANVQPGEYGYKDPNEKKKKPKEKPREKEAASQMEEEKGNEVYQEMGNVQPGDFGFKDIDKRQNKKIKSVQRSAPEPMAAGELPDYLEKNTKSGSSEGDSDDLPDYLKPDNAEKGDSWQN